MGLRNRLLGLFSRLRSFTGPVPTPPKGVPGSPVALYVGHTGPVWCVVANVLLERKYGAGGREIRRGTKHFSPGAKVHVFSFYWGMGGESVTVVGRHRKSKRYITLIMQPDHLANWRAELVYSPHIVRQILASGEVSRLPPGGEESKAHAEKIAASYVEQGAVTQPFLTR